MSDVLQSWNEFPVSSSFSRFMHLRYFCGVELIATFSGLLFPKFRCGWKMSLHVIPQKSSEKSSLLTYMVIAEKDNSVSFSLISSSIEQSSFGRNESQVGYIIFSSLELLVQERGF